MNFTALHEILLVLANPDSTRAERNEALRLLDPWLELVKATLRNKFDQAKVGDITLDTAVEHVRQQVSTGSNRYVGKAGGRSAMSYIRTIGEHKVIDELRRMERDLHRARAEAERRWRDELEAEEDRRRALLSERVWRMAEEYVRRTLLPFRRWHRFWRLVYDQTWSPLTLDEQIRVHKYLRGPDPDAETVRRAKQLLDKHRQRGRRFLGTVVRCLWQSNWVDERDAAEFCGLHRIDWPPRPVRQGKRRSSMKHDA